jgi:hypothetical protein
MSEIRISLQNGRMFDWTGTREQGLFIINAMESAAKKGGVTFDALTHSCIKHALGKTTLTSEEQEHFSAGILAFVLQSETGNQEHPGRFVDYLDNTDFKIDIDADGKHFGIVANATSRFHA